MTPDEKRAHRAAYMRAYRASNPDYMEKARQRQHARVTSEEGRRRGRDSKRESIQRLRSKGVHTETHLTRDEFAAMSAAQGGVCAICRKPETKLSAKGRVRRLSIDHDHRTGRVRALLCARCNSAVGYLEDDPRLGERVVAYMRLQEGLAYSWAMEEMVGSQRPVVIRRHRVEQIQREAADAMERAVGL